MDYPPEEVERSIIVDKCNADGYAIPNQVIDQMISIGTQIRAMADPINGGEITVSWGVRLSVKTALFAQFMPLPEAFGMTLGDRLDPEQRDLIMAVVRDA